MVLHDRWLLDAYISMYRIRIFELRLAEAVRDSYDVSRYVHLCCGHEAVAVGACAAVRPSDWITLTYRGHGVHLARGAEPRRILDEIWGLDTGYLRGRGGSMHLVAPHLGIVDAAGIVGGNLPVALGCATKARVLGGDEATLCFFGDGATSTGAFHESLNMAALWRLPVIFICENNRRAVGTRFDQLSAVPCVVDRASAYGMPASCVDGKDPLAVRTAVAAAVQTARAGLGPTLIECHVELLMGHFASGTAESAQLPELSDPVQILRSRLVEADDGRLDAEISTRVAEVDRELDGVFGVVRP